MRVLFYSAVAMAASLANIASAVSLEDMGFLQDHSFEQFAQLSAFLADDTPAADKKAIGIQVGDMKVSAGGDADPAELAKVLDTAKAKAGEGPPKGKKVGDGDCDCKESVGAAKAKSEAAVSAIKGEQTAATAAIKEQ